MFFVRSKDKMREKQMTFFNTTGETGEVLRESKDKAFNQQVEIYNFLKRHPKKSYTPCEIQELVLPKAPITSVRRALTNLTAARHIQKTHNMRQGKDGKYVHTWRLI